MTRLASLEKAGYYPYPLEHQAALCSLFSAESGARLLDPCSGEGVVLQALQEALPLSDAYANELDTTRARACREKFGPLHAVQGDMYRLRASNSAFSLLFVNPPYAWEATSRDKRREFDMLHHAWKWAQPGGFVVWVVYAHHVTRRAADFLCRWSDQVDIWRIPGLHLEEYKQVVVVAHVAPRKQLDFEERAEALALSAHTGSMPTLTVREAPVYRLPKAAAVKRFFFTPDHITPEFAALALEQTGGAHKLASFQQRFEVPPAARKIRPVIKPRGGQLAMMLAAGAFESLTLNIEGMRTGVRATIRMVDDLHKVIPATSEDSVDIAVYHSRPEVTLALLSEKGELTKQSGDEALLSFIRTHKKALLAYVERNFEPLYHFKLSPALRRKLDAVRINGKRLYEVQKHVVGALQACLSTHQTAILVGEQGFGKTPTCASVILTTPIKAGQAALVVCPPHLTHDKWLREASEVMCGAFIRVLSDVSQVAAFFRECKTLPPEMPKLGILSFTGAKLNEHWTPAVHWQRSRYEVLNRLEALRRYRWTWNGTQMVRVPLRLSYVWRWTVVSGKKMLRQVYLDMDKLSHAALTKLKDELPICPSCGVVVRLAPTGKDDEGQPVSEEYLAAAERACPTCGHALWQDERLWSKAPENPRAALAQFIARRYGDQVGLVVFDEFHALKGRESAQGQAMLALANIPHVKVLGATGTLSNGLASGLYVLMFAVSPSIRANYPWGKRGEKDASAGLAAWSQRMGRLEKMVVYNGDEQEKSGSASSVRRNTVGRPREIPGTTPYLVAEVLDRAVFVGISDLGTAMPPLVQEAIAVPMDHDMAEIYEEAVGQMKRHLVACRREGDNTFAGIYRQAALSWPNAAHRTEVVLHGSAEVAVMPSLGSGRVYPKERVLLDLLSAAISRGERAVLFLRQTATRNIQPRLEALIREHVPLACPWILPSSTKPAKRMPILREKTAAGVNVIIANTKLLETGVDLLGHRLIVFYELDDAYQTISQASRRHWRVGQDKECRTVYLYYTAPNLVTMEHAQTLRTARKEVAASLLYGEVAEGGLSDADEDKDDSALLSLVSEFAADRSIAGPRELFAAVNERRNMKSESAWLGEEGVESETERTVKPPRVEERIVLPPPVLEPLQQLAMF